MASRVTKVKQEQGYNPKPIWPVCGNCADYTSKKDLFGNEKSKRCKIGGFGVAKMGTCNHHKFMDGQ